MDEKIKEKIRTYIQATPSSESIEYLNYSKYERREFIKQASIVAMGALIQKSAFEIGQMDFKIINSTAKLVAEDLAEEVVGE